MRYQFAIYAVDDDDQELLDVITIDDDEGLDHATARARSYGHEILATQPDGDAADVSVALVTN